MHRLTDHNLLIDALQPTIKPIAEYSGRELTTTVLKIIAISGLLATFVVVPTSAQILTLFEPRTPRERQRVHAALHSLKRQGYIKQGSDAAYRVTENGLTYAHRVAFAALKFPVAPTWDGVWRVIMYDIPKRKQRASQHLSWKLADVGCVRVQRSIFVYPYPCKRELDAVTGQLGLREHTVYFEALSIPDGTNIAQRLKLPPPTAARTRIP